MKDNVCQGNQKHYDYFLDWIADIVQNPGKKNGIAVALRGIPGAGKTIVGDIIIELLGNSMAVAVDASAIDNHFNFILSNKLFIVADESIWAGDRKVENKLKKMITDKTINIEPKGKDTYELDNHMRILFTSNNDWMVPVDKGDRRYFVLDVGDDQVRNPEYFRLMMEELENGGYGKLMYVLKNRDLSKRVWREIPETEAKVEQRLNNLEIFDKWVFDSVDYGYVTETLTFDWYIYRNEDQESDGYEIPLLDLYKKFSDYNSYVGRNREYRLNSNSFGKKWSRMTGMESKRIREDGKQIRVRVVPNKEDLLKMLGRFTDIDVDLLVEMKN